jgi:hypothetical protein
MQEIPRRSATPTGEFRDAERRRLENFATRSDADWRISRRMISTKMNATHDF